MSDEASSHPDTYAITDYDRRRSQLQHRAASRPAPTSTSRARPARGISYVTSGNLFDGVNYWTGSGDDNDLHRRHKPTAPSGRRRSSTPAWATTTVDGQPHGAGSDGFFVLETSGGSSTANAVAQSESGYSDDDTVDAHLSSLPLVIIGGYGNDSITGGSGNDIILGDRRRRAVREPGARPTRCSRSSASAAAAT